MEFRLGKLEAKQDERTLKLSAVLATPPAVPDKYDVDVKPLPLPMFANDTYGDCVIAGRAHQTLRFERTEQRKLLAIRDGDVLREYMKETGGEDGGLNVLDSLKAWRKGWRAAGQTYDIHAFLSMNPLDVNEVKAGIYLMSGAGCGLQLPLTAQEQFARNLPWDVEVGPDSGPGSWGGHYVYLCGYNPTGPVCVTWGRKQQMTWPFWKSYCDEVFAIADDRDKFLKNSPIDVHKLDALLAEVQAA